MATKEEIFQEKLQAYISGDKATKGEIVDAVVLVTGMHRKSVIRRFRREQTKDSRLHERRGRPPKYTKDVDAALYDVWVAANEPCGELLFPLINEYVDIFIRDNQWKHDDIATGKLRAMSKRTVRRRCEAFTKKYGIHRGKSSTNPSH